MKSLSAAKLHDMMLERPGMPVLNVLPREMHRESHVPGTPNVPVTEDDFAEQVEGLVSSKDEPVVVYCKNKSCDASEKAGRMLEEAGFTNVYDFEGGIEEWEQAGYSLVAT